LWVSIFFGFCVAKFEKADLLRGEFFSLSIGHIGYKKIENFMLIFKKPTCRSDKIPPKKLQRTFSNFAKSHLFRFFILSFWGHFVTKVSLHF
jgi:hypothetical protein